MKGEAMKKPHGAIDWLREYMDCQQVLGNRPRDLLTFLDSLPDTFEIVEPGKVQVEWPTELTSERLELFASTMETNRNRNNTWASEYFIDIENALRALAAIAPRKRTRMVNLWRKPDGEVVARDPDHFVHVDSGWRKVNPQPIKIED